MLDPYVWRDARGYYMSDRPPHQLLALGLWHPFFKWPVDTIPDRWDRVEEKLRGHFFGCEWDEVYDFVQFIAEHTSGWSDSERFAQTVNGVLEQELSAWRLVGGQIVEITSPAEIEEIDAALVQSPAPVRTHLEAAVQLLADRTNPDYRNSIKESISAVEALVNQINGSTDTLGAGLKKLGVDAHPAFVEAYSKIYGYTSNADGIRHALSDEATLNSEDARFMLVSCSAFVSYLTAKAVRADVKV